MPLLTQNRELRADRVWNWTLPAWVVTLTDGTSINVCPNAGVCKDLCYAKNGTYLFSNVKAAHLRNLEWTLTDLPGWEEAMTKELTHRRYRPTGTPRYLAEVTPWDLDPWAADWMLTGGQGVRIHDAGDFYSDPYLQAWLRIAEATPDVLFYAYTKEVTRMRDHAHLAPVNFRWLYSMGGKQDHLIDPDRDRHAEVFPDLAAMKAHGYTDQSGSDLLAVLLPTTRIGIPANNIAHFKKKQGAATFGELEASRTRHSRTPKPTTDGRQTA